MFQILATILDFETPVLEFYVHNRCFKSGVLSGDTLDACTGDSKLHHWWLDKEMSTAHHKWWLETPCWSFVSPPMLVIRNSTGV